MHAIRTFRRATPFAISALLVAAALAPGTAMAATGAPTLRLLTGQSSVVVARPGNSRFFVDPGVLVTPEGGSFELELHSATIGGPISLTQVWTDSTGTHTRTLPSDALKGWSGLRDFFHVTVHAANGKVVHRETRPFCPNSYSPQRVKPDSPPQPTFPQFCGVTFDPFVQGNLWGVDHGWATSALASSGFFEGPGGFFGEGLRLRLPNGRYQIKVAVSGRFVGMFHMDAARSVATVGLTVKTGSGGCRDICPGGAQTRPSNGGLPQLPAVADSAPPPPQYLPDLNALPAFGISTFHHGDQDYLAFGSTEWIGGGSDLDVQGFRRHNSNTMDAYQYFFRDGQVVGKARVGTFEFDTRHGHDHWHIEQYARYSLLDSHKTLAVRSHKQSFCIAPTDAIDLTVPGAVATPGIFGFVGNCGSPTSVWVRETLPLGWGDTYLQNVGGQALNITGLPNGTYYVSVEVNPLGLLYEQSTSNDTALRRVIIMGHPGHRTVCVPAINGVDQEGNCKS
jgi:lysyl oxidase